MLMLMLMLTPLQGCLHVGLTGTQIISYRIG